MSSRAISVEETISNEGQSGHQETASPARTERRINGAAVEHSHMNNAPLRHSIDQALECYFRDLEGTEPADLYNMVLQEVEYPLLARVLDYTRGNQSRAAEILGINRSTLRKKLRSHGLLG